jgi:PAS domain S-box-containing protein
MEEGLRHLFSEIQRRLPARVLALVLLRVLVILASFAWLAFAWPGLDHPRIVAAVLSGFLVHGVVLFALLWRRTEQVLRWNVAVMLVDMGFALALVALTGGARSVFFLAFYLITALQAYYCGIRQGVAVALGASALYLGVVWPTLEGPEWPDFVLRGGMLLLTGVGLGVLAEVEERERGKVRALNQELAVRERCITEILESLRDGVVVLDQSRRITTWNRAMAERFELPAGAVLGRPVVEVFPSLGEDGRPAALDRLFAGQAPGVTLERVVHERRPGEPRVLNIKGSVTRAHDGREPGVVLLVEDVTDRVAFEQSTRRAEKLAAIGTLSTGLAHEINNPIGVITSRIELMLEEAGAQGLPAGFREDLDVLRRHALRVARITQGLLSFARQAPGARAPLDLNAVVQETLLLVAKPAAKEGITLRPRLAPALPPVLGDANQLAQVVLNLVNNAREAIQGAGEIGIETDLEPARPGWVRLRISDTGIGIPEEHQAKIFDPFFTTKPAGTGLGLSVSYGIVKDHGGSLSVQSRVGAGTTFTLSFPGAEHVPPGAQQVLPGAQQVLRGTQRVG